MTSSIEKIREIILKGTREEKRELFSFNDSSSEERVVKKFELFSRAFYPRYFKQKSAPFHRVMILNYVKSYRGANVMEIGHRGCSKTSILKLFVTFVLLNDLSAFRKYVKVLTKDGKNSKQIVTDIYNLMLEARDVYGPQFDKEDEKKREETMGSFTMKDGRKLTAGTIGQTQRGHVQDAYRPDWIWFDDIEDRESIASQVITQGIISKIEEALDGRAKGGSYVCTANYLSEDGSVQYLKNRTETVHIVPLFKDGIVDGELNWPIYSLAEVAEFKKSLDFYGEYMCDPARSENKFFNIDRIEDDIKNARTPKRESAGIKYWSDYLPHHRYGAGADTSEGIGLDANTLGLFDFTTGELVATYANNQIAPDLFGYEAKRLGSEFGNCILAIERNNTGHTTISAIKDYPNLYRERNTDNVYEKTLERYGWHTNAKTKPEMMFAFRKDYNDGLIKIYDVNVLKEMKSYSNVDLQDKSVGLVTRHFDLLMAAIIAWQMKIYSSHSVIEDIFEEEGPLYSDIGI